MLSITIYEHQYVIVEENENLVLKFVLFVITVGMYRDTYIHMNNSGIIIVGDISSI